LKIWRLFINAPPQALFRNRARSVEPPAIFIGFVCGSKTTLCANFAATCTKSADLSMTRWGFLRRPQVGLRGVVVYFVLILFVRVGKKRFLGQATAFDAVLIILIGSVASRAVSGTAPFVASLAATLSFIVVHWLVSYFAQRSSTLSFLVKGHDTLLIKNGRVDQSALRAAHMSPDDLEEDLRQQGIKKHTDVEEARLERSGKLSVIKK
jgi:uncharacterized membrane protein YcaP (DUF421 family)